MRLQLHHSLFLQLLQLLCWIEGPITSNQMKYAWQENWPILQSRCTFPPNMYDQGKKRKHLLKLTKLHHLPNTFVKDRAAIHQVSTPYIQNNEPTQMCSVQITTSVYSMSTESCHYSYAACFSLAYQHSFCFRCLFFPLIYLLFRGVL